MRLDLNRAATIAGVIVSSMQSEMSVDLTLIDPPVRFSNGWIFLYDSEEYLRTGDIGAAIGGNAPIAVFESGNVEILDTRNSIELHVERLDARATR